MTVETIVEILPNAEKAGKPWRFAGKFDTFCEADNLRKKIAKNSKPEDKVNVKVKRHGFGGNEFVVKVRSDAEPKPKKKTKSVVEKKEKKASVTNIRKSGKQKRAKREKGKRGKG